MNIFHVFYKKVIIVAPLREFNVTESDIVARLSFIKKARCLPKGKITTHCRRCERAAGECGNLLQNCC